MDKLDVNGRRFYTGDIVFDVNNSDKFIVAKRKKYTSDGCMYSECFFTEGYVQGITESQKLVILGNAIDASEELSPMLISSYKCMIELGIIV